MSTDFRDSGRGGATTGATVAFGALDAFDAFVAEPVECAIFFSSGSFPFGASGTRCGRAIAAFEMAAIIPEPLLAEAAVPAFVMAVLEVDAGARVVDVVAGTILAHSSWRLNLR